MSLWRTMLIRFNATPAQLFTFGLKPGSYAHVWAASPFLNAGFCRALERICTHPIWGEDLSRLRYVLQTAVSLRIPNHVKPIVPAPREVDNGQWASIAVPGVEEEETSKMADTLQYMASVSLDRDPFIQSVIRALERSVKLDESYTTLLCEDKLFELGSGDLDRVIEALDEARPLGWYVVPISVEDSHKAFSSTYNFILSQIPPQTAEELRSFGWRMEVSRMRDEVIRLAIEKAKVPGEFLLDGQNLGRHADLVHLYEHHPNLDSRVAEVLRGLPSKHQADIRMSAFRTATAAASFEASVKRLGQAAAKSPAVSSSIGPA
ncbi:hypothetical protein F5Y05DRAFT_102103 [Hypoxylon sp. FL0543]|nr:hypothetical protein F5Y05DRAFT_102103 [Hypoxylon sp. FL0543]